MPLIDGPWQIKMQAVQMYIFNSCVCIYIAINIICIEKGIIWDVKQVKIFDTLSLD